MMKKIFILIVLLSAIFFEIPLPSISQTEKPVFKYGVGRSPETFDPAHAWDSASIDLLDQVCEGLLAYDLFDPELTLIPRLATDLGTWNSNATEITFTLRRNVTFHDGMPFNATAVKYSFDRLTHLIEGNISQLKELYEPLSDLYPTTPLLINETVVVTEFTVKFILNYPYVPFVSLLCFSGSYIVHPKMPLDRCIQMNETLIGTGPYMLDYYTVEEIHFLAYQGYYRPQPEIQEIFWIQYNDDIEKQEALLAGRIHMADTILPDYLEEFQANQNLIVHEPQARTSITYIGMNNKIINKTYRQSISYAIDYSYIITDIMKNLTIRMKSIVPVGMLYHDATVESPVFDLKRARQILIDAELSRGLSAASLDYEWINLAESTNPIAVFNLTYNLNSRCSYCELHSFLVSSLKRIGIKLELYALTWPQFLERLMGDYDKLQLFRIGWTADYNDPSCFINPLMSNISRSNIAQVNDPWLQNAMNQALTEIDPEVRRTLYSEIQHYISEELIPWVFLFQPFFQSIHHKALGNFPINAMNKINFYPCTWNLKILDNPFASLQWNIRIVLLSLLGVSIVLILYIHRKSHPYCI